MTSQIRKVVLLCVGLCVMSALVAAQGITIDLGKTLQGRYIKLVGNAGDGAVQDLIKINPEYCAKNLGTSMYFDIQDDFFSQLAAGSFVMVNVEYYDTLNVDISLTYDDQTSHNLTYASKITTAGTNKWKSYNFFLSDAYFGNSLTNGADFKITSTGTMFINAVSVVPFGKYINYGDGPCAGGTNDSDDVFGITHNEYQGGDSRTKYQQQDGEWCITGTTGSQYLYCGVDDAYILNGNHPYVFVSVEYYDAAPLDPGQTFRLQYDGASKNYTSTQYVSGKGWGCYRTYTFEISDALFNNRENGLSDMRLSMSKAGLLINRITVAILPKKPLPNTANIANQTAYRLLEPPAVDGDLSDWSWMTPYTLQPLFSGDGSRSDEFYRTWLLNNENVPIVETGEPGVTDPATPGLWDQNDLKGWYRMGWDTTNVYVAIAVKDNVKDVAGTNWKEEDGLGLYFDVSHSYNNVGGVDVPVAIRDNNTFQQGEQFIFLTASSSELGWWRHSTSQTGEALTSGSGIQKTVVLTDSGYVIEASIPLAFLRDGLAWKPGVLGDRDNFNPLFSYVLNDADNVGPTSGRLAFGGHNEDDEFWGTVTMAPAPLVDRGIIVDLGATNYENLMAQVNKGGDGVTTPVAIQGKKCVQTTGGYVYFDVSNAVLTYSHPKLLVAVEYLDTIAGVQFRLQYDGLTNPYTDSPWITLGNTNTWKTAIFDVNDAKFASSENAGADFRIHCPTNNLYINQVRVVLADLWLNLGDTTGHGIVDRYPGTDGVRLPANVGGSVCQTNNPGAGYMYFAVADSLIYQGNHREVFVTVEYYDTTSTSGVSLNYDGVGNKWSNSDANAFILGTNQWKLHTFYLPDAYFGNLENGGSDFRVNNQGSTSIFVRRMFVGATDSLQRVGVEDAEVSAPYTFGLAQNYPNPFNPSTTIGYEVPQNGLTVLKVYNILGQEVATLVNTVQRAGRYTAVWDASRFASGMYICALRQDGKLQTKKLLLVK